LTLRSKTRVAIPVVAALAGSLALAACSAANESSGSSSSSGSATSSAPKLNGSLNGAGSSAQQAAMQAWTAGFSAQQSGVTINYDPVGSGGGRQQFLSGGVDFAGSDAYLTDAEVTQATTQCGSSGYFELPNYVSGIAVVYNLQGNDGLQFSPDTLAKVFNGSITTWNDPAIAADNPGKNLPNTKITPVHRSDNSGTTQNFTDYLHQAAPGVWTYPAAGTWPVQGGEAGAQTAGVVAAVKAGAGAIGYVDESQSTGFQVGKVKVGSSYVAPSAKADAAVVSSSQTVPGRAAADLAISINRTTTNASEYPIVLVSYHIGCLAPKDTNKGAILKAFENYVISSDGQQAAAKTAGSAPISDAQRSKSQKVVDQFKG
jgi:phosphate transport system substrate-binding protein